MLDATLGAGGVRRAADVRMAHVLLVETHMPKVRLALLLSGTIVAGATMAEAQCVFEARERAIVGDGTQSTASVATTGAGGLTKLGRKVRFADDTAVAGDEVKLGNGASVDDLQVNRLTEGKGIVVRGDDADATLTDAATFCPLPEFACGGADVSVASGKTRELAPGRYGAIVLDRGATLELLDGVYEVCELTTAKNAVVLTVGAGTTLHVVERFGMANGSLFGLGAGGTAATVNVAGGGSVKFGRRVDVTAAISAPDAEIVLGNGSQFAGELCAKRFNSGKRSELSCVDVDS